MKLSWTAVVYDQESLCTETREKSEGECMTYEEYVHRLSGSKMTDKALKELFEREDCRDKMLHKLRTKTVHWMQIDLPEEV